MAADFRTHWFARVDSILTAENKKIMQGRVTEKKPAKKKSGLQINPRYWDETPV